MDFSLTFIIILIVVSSSEAQISFGSSSSDNNNSNRNTVSEDDLILSLEPSAAAATSKLPVSNGISFSSTSRKQLKKKPHKIDPKRVLLKDILKLEGQDLKSPVVNTRFGFGASVTPKVGQSCRTPLSEAGTCQVR